MSRVVAIAWLAWLAAAPAAFAAADGDLDKVMAALAAHRSGETSFVEKKFLAVLDRPIESSGELSYRAPDHLEKRTLEPKAETLSVDGDRVSAQRGRHVYVLDLQRYPAVVPLIESMRATLAGDRPALERVFTVGFSGTFDQWTLRLVPRDHALVGTFRQIEIRGTRDILHSVEIDEADGDRSILTMGPDAAS